MTIILWVLAGIWVVVTIAGIAMSIALGDALADRTAMIVTWVLIMLGIGVEVAIDCGIVWLIWIGIKAFSGM